MSTAVVLSLGSNLGDREATLRAAVADVAAIDGVTVTAVSGLVETPAVKPHGVDTEAPAYLNAVLAARSDLAAHDLLRELNRVEAEHGRVRDIRWGDRTLDIDIVTFGDDVIDTDRLSVPHPRAHERGFVLAPWLQIDPDATLPGFGRVADLFAALADAPPTPFVAEPLL